MKLEMDLYKWSENHLECDITLSDCIKIIEWCDEKIIDPQKEICNESLNSLINLRKSLIIYTTDCSGDGSTNGRVLMESGKTIKKLQNTHIKP